MKSFFPAIALAGVLAVGAVAITGCNSSTNPPKPADKMNDDKMAGDKMSDNKMSGDKMAGDKMSGDKLSGDKMKDSK